jgi:preprotein translocase subunit SecF
MLNIVKYRYLFFGISLLIIVPGVIALLVWGLPVGIEFTGGSLLEVRFDSGKVPASEEVRQLYSEFGYDGAEIQTTSQNGLIIRSRDLDETTEGKIVAEIETRFGSPVTILRFDRVGPSVGQEVARSAALAVGAAALAILAYITFAFRGIKHSFRYGVSAIIAMLHDVLVVVGVEAILGHFLDGKLDHYF